MSTVLTTTMSTYSQQLQRYYDFKISK